MFGRLTKREFGSEIEALVCEYLTQQGCSIIETNFLCKLGEIDIIASYDKTLIFVEVRYRKKSGFGGAAESVNFKKRQRIINTAQFYLQQNKLTNKTQGRFDVFCVEGNGQRMQYNWIKDAFSAEW
ncbi:YraN family protein [Aliikangiella marina]|uniref:YraN family protein n=1 Tax=Aliikangiella marina TaxID=1712262 RepID=UPI00163D572C|nr:YraN family protein [Aliikangiella marina]